MSDKRIIIHTCSRSATMNMDSVVPAQESYRISSCTFAKAVCCDTFRTTHTLNTRNITKQALSYLN